MSLKGFKNSPLWSHCLSPIVWDITLEALYIVPKNADFIVGAFWRNKIAIWKIFRPSPGPWAIHFLRLFVQNNFDSTKNGKRSFMPKLFFRSSVTWKKLPNVYKSCPKLISLKKWKILTPLQKLPKNEGALDKLIAAKGFKKLPKVQ